MKEKEGK